MIIDQTFEFIKRGLDASVARHELIADNIANVSTPNYKRKDLNFRSILKSSMTGMLEAKITHQKHFVFSMDQSSPYRHVIYPNVTDVKSDGNNVDVDKEIVTMVNNNVYYNALSTFATRKIRILKDVLG